MSQIINVLVAATPPDTKARVIAEMLLTRPDMNLIKGPDDICVAVDEVEELLKSISPTIPCALVLVGRSIERNEPAERWLAARDDLVVMQVEVVGDMVRVGFRNPGLEPLLTALRELVERVGTRRGNRVVSIQLRPVPTPEDSTPSIEQSTGRPLLNASINWLRALMRDAVEAVPEEKLDEDNVAVTRRTRGTILQSLDAPFERVHNDEPSELKAAETELDNALAEDDEPLATAVHSFPLGPLEFRLMVLTLAPELDIRFQRAIGFLLDDMGLRVGTMALYSNLLGLTARVRGELVGGSLLRWLVFEGYTGRPAAADEPLRLDPFLAQWLLGERKALGNDPRVRRALQVEQWPGATLLYRAEERVKARALIEELKKPAKWILLDGTDAPGWRALLELGALLRALMRDAVEAVPEEKLDEDNVAVTRRTRGTILQSLDAPFERVHDDEPSLIRIEASRLAGVEILEVEECARRIGRMALLTGDPLVIDLTKAEAVEADDDWLRVFLATLERTGCRAALICRDEARVVRFLGTGSFELRHESPVPAAARVAAVRKAAKEAGAYLMTDVAEAIANRYPLHVDSLEYAAHLAPKRPKNSDADDPQLDRLIRACKELASEGISHLVERIDPIFKLEDVVLPPDRKQQLVEIVDNVRFAHRVLDEWKFRDQLPYGRGVTALFFGPSGTGKTMAAMGISRALAIQILRLDLSRVVSKYIGDTEKNIDRVFTDAQRSGAAILIDEADALLGKRSEVKDAHDRYANIEVAFLLQRMEAFEGLAILTTNMRKNLDAAFLRRLRFIIEFPRPDIQAREKIWRQCLPDESHDLEEAGFRQLARRIDLTGGQIRQVTLRAAFIAAAADDSIGLEHIAQATRAELAKLGMPPIELDLTEARRAA